MTISKVKDWVKNSKPQFEITRYVPGGSKIVSNVKRLMDGRTVQGGYFYEINANQANNIFPYNNPYESASLMIYEFNQDFIHVKYELMFIKKGGEAADSINRECEINDIIFTSDNKGIVGFYKKIVLNK